MVSSKPGQVQGLVNQTVRFMNLKKYTWKGSKCDFMGIGGVCLTLFLFYMFGTRLIESYKSGEVVFRYHSNLFYGKEAVYLYVVSFLLVSWSALYSFFSVRKCYRKIENENKKI